MWTSGVPCTLADDGKMTGLCKSATWCSSNKTAKLKYSVNVTTKGAKCLAISRVTKRFTVLDCRKKALAVCEVTFHIDLIERKQGYPLPPFIFTVNLPGSTLPRRANLQKKCEFDFNNDIKIKFIIGNQPALFETVGGQPVLKGERDNFIHFHPKINLNASTTIAKKLFNFDLSMHFHKRI
jgi:hypothetical protein